MYGVTGSGKSTLAARIGERLGLPYHAVDELTWDPGWVPVSEDGQRERIGAICATDEWVLDSAYGMWLDLPLARADLVVGLDLPRLVSLSRLVRRTVGHVIRKDPTCNGNVETFRNSFLNRESILVWHFRSFRRKRTRMRAWQADPARPEVVLLRSSREVERWLSGAGRVTEYSWPEQGVYEPDRLRAAWPTTVKALPVGARVMGDVIARQRFGLFIRIDGVPDSLGLVEITAMPRDLALPDLGTPVTGEVIGHAEHNHQVRLRLLESPAAIPAGLGSSTADESPTGTARLLHVEV